MSKQNAKKQKYKKPSPKPNTLDKNVADKVFPAFLIKRLVEGCFIFVITCAVFIILSLSTYHPDDPGWSLPQHLTHHKHVEVLNAGGQVGAYLADGLFFLMGYICYLLPIYAIYIAWRLMQRPPALLYFDKSTLLLRGFGLVFFTLGTCGLLSLVPIIKAVNGSQSAGGIFGDIMARIFKYALNTQGAFLLLIAILLVGTTWLTGFSWVKIMELMGRYALMALTYICRMSMYVLKNSANYLNQIKPIVSDYSSSKMKLPILRPVRLSPKIMPIVDSQTLVAKKTINQSPASDMMVKLVQDLSKNTANHPVISNNVVTLDGLPSLDLLDKAKIGKPLGGFTPQELERLSREVEQHLLDFGIHADVVAVHPGPVITRFELQLAAGIKVSKLTALSKDLARSLSVTSVRVVEVIPGKTVVGLELPNQHRKMVVLSEVLSADVYQQAQSVLTLALGVDIAGHPMVVDLAKMPHLLVAGTTGSGKSVGINAMILSLLFKASPEQVRLIMIDPKMLELSVYQNIPHLLTPVVTDMKEAASSLRWCVAEMERRYRLMSALGVRNIAGYNLNVTDALASGSPLYDPLWKAHDGVDDGPALLSTLPYVVVIIDELADMMMVVGKKVEQLIARIAQKARAAGIHLILATQRPSVDVLTGLIKSNIPTRISFQVSSKIDSRTILDQQGADQLLGHGDMLFLAPGTGAPLRVHGAFVDDKEVHRIADDWRKRGEPNYIEEITQTHDTADQSLTDEGKTTEDSDPLYDQAVEFVLQTRKASISSVQRRLKVGYNRAARLVEEMERTGIVGPLEGGYRDVLVTSVSED